MDQSVFIYGDLLFILQVLWNGYFLFISADIVNYHLSKWQICTIVFILSMDFFLIFCRPWMRFLLFAMEWGMVYIISRSKKLCFVLFLVSVVAGGIWRMIPEIGLAAAAIGLALLMLYKKYIPKSNIYTVYCLNKGKKVKLKALYDTGNSLHLSEGEMVFLVFYEAIKPIFDWTCVGSPRMVSFSSVGKEDGLLLAVPIDAFVILEKNMEIKNPYIGIIEQKLSNSDEYQMILHKDVFCGRK